MSNGLTIKFDPNKMVVAENGKTESEFTAVTGLSLPENRGGIQAFLVEVDNKNQPSLKRMALYLDFKDFKPVHGGQPYSKSNKYDQTEFTTGDTKALTISGACQIAEFDIPANMKPDQIKEALGSEIYFQIDSMYKRLNENIIKDLHDIDSQRLVTSPENEAQNDLDINDELNNSLYESIASNTANEFRETSDADYHKSLGIKSYNVSETYHERVYQNTDKLTADQFHDRANDMESELSSTNNKAAEARNHWHSAGRKLRAALAFTTPEKTTSPSRHDDDTESLVSSGIASSEDPEDDYQKVVFDDELSDSSEVSATSTVPLGPQQFSDDVSSTGSRMSPREMAKQRHTANRTYTLGPEVTKEVQPTPIAPELTEQKLGPVRDANAAKSRLEAAKKQEAVTAAREAGANSPQGVQPQLPPKSAPPQDLRKIGEKINSATNSSSPSSPSAPSSPSSTTSLPPLRKK